MDRDHRTACKPLGPDEGFDATAAQAFALHAQGLEDGAKDPRMLGGTVDDDVGEPARRSISPGWKILGLHIT